MALFSLRRQRWIVAIVSAILVVVVAAYLATPYVIKNYLNDNVLNNVGDYHGYVEDVDVNLLKGAYKLQDVYLYRK